MPSALDEDRPQFRPSPCPHCGEPLKLVPLLFGYPAPEVWRAVERGEVELGGCMVTDDDPEFVCSICREPVYHGSRSA